MNEQEDREQKGRGLREAKPFLAKWLGIYGREMWKKPNKCQGSGPVSPPAVDIGERLLVPGTGWSTETGNREICPCPQSAMTAREAVCALALLPSPGPLPTQRRMPEGVDRQRQACWVSWCSQQSALGSAPGLTLSGSVSASWCLHLWRQLPHLHDERGGRGCTSGGWCHGRG